MTTCERPDECASGGHCIAEPEHAAWPEWDTSRHFDWCGTCGRGVRNTPEGWTHE